MLMLNIEILKIHLTYKLVVDISSQELSGKYHL